MLRWMVSVLEFVEAPDPEVQKGLVEAVVSAEVEDLVVGLCLEVGHGPKPSLPDGERQTMRLNCLIFRPGIHWVHLM